MFLYFSYTKIIIFIQIIQIRMIQIGASLLDPLETGEAGIDLSGKYINVPITF